MSDRSSSHVSNSNLFSFAAHSQLCSNFQFIHIYVYICIYNFSDVRICVSVCILNSCVYMWIGWVQSF